MMNLSTNRDACFLSASEACAVKAAVRTAVMSILKLFQQLNEKRSHCYELKLTEAERENAALKMHLHAAEQELQTLRLNGSNVQSSAEGNLSHDFSCKVPEEPREEPVCLQSDSESESVLVLKEEQPFDQNKLCIKSELIEECSTFILEDAAIESAQICQKTARMNTYGPKHNHTCSIDPDPVLTESERRRMTRYENVRRYRERIRADPVKYLAWKEKNHLRYLQNRKTINELPEPMKKLQRKAWREATRRHRAKQMAQFAPPATSMSQTPSL